ncbi:hypothetical protein B0H12DRAFT_1134579 [Mycena haematopus]|nr:hypothetical protein B0H12DRAFT_1134579 [Mycena haematopus]
MGKSKRKEKDDARELWCPSPTPSEDWGSDADVDFQFEILGEEVGFNGKMKYEVLWHNWQRSDGTSTTWEGSTDNAAILDAVSEWDAKRIAALPDTTDVELWGTTDIVNTRTRLRKQGYEPPTEQEMAELQAEGDAMVLRMEELMAEGKQAHPHLFPLDASRSETQAPTAAPRPSRVHVNAEAGSSRLGPPTAPLKSTQVSPRTASSSSARTASRIPTPLPPPRVPSHRAGSPAISISSSVESIEFVATNPAPKALPPQSSRKRRAASPPQTAPPPPLKRRGLPVPRENVSTLRAVAPTSASDNSRPPPSAASLSKPSAIAHAEKSRPNTPRSSTSTRPDSALIDNPPTKPVPTPPGGATGKRKATSPPRASPPPPPKLRGLPIPRDVASASLPAIRTTTSGSDKLRSAASAASLLKPSPATASTTSISAGSTSISSARAISASALPSVSTPPRRPLIGAVRKCECGTLLPPPDVHQLAVCDPCRSVAQRWQAKRDGINDRGRTSIRSGSQGWRSDASTVRASSIASTSASGRELRGWKEEKAGSAVVSVPHRKGKVPESRKRLRLQVESAWTAIAQSCDGEGSADVAAGITFANDVDEEEIPSSLHGGEFTYLEDRYHPAETLPFELYPDSATPLTDAGAFTFCHCKRCDEFDGCCQDTDSEIQGYAYTDGLFNFTYGPDDVVVECNPYCTCPTTCGNRVAQRPRRVPIEVFKTKQCGWGVRATEDVVRGTVVGMYTGKLIPRAEAEVLRGDRKQYCFDLDYNEDDDVPLEETYSVDAFECGASLIPSFPACSCLSVFKNTSNLMVFSGNWTRFINHSCAPNLRVQPVVYDTLPHQRIAFLAFIAMQRIPARTEFTFDYDPDAQRAYEDAAAAAAKKGKKGSFKQQRPRGAHKCMCGTERCRGWVRT